jgi:GNAT superfamily N-acetyltransferase
MIDYRDTCPDPEAYLSLFETTGWNDGYRADSEDLGTALDCSHFVVSAYTEHELVGVGRAVADGLHAIIYDLIVHPVHQGQGVGSEILRRLVARCRNDRICDIQLFSAHGTAAFYERHGFARRPDDAPGMEQRFRGGVS